MWSKQFFTALMPYFALSVADQPKVSIKNGTVVGVHSYSYDQDFFLGIPYAMPPTGDRRFRPPQPYDQTFNEFDASHYSPLCVGYGVDDLPYNDNLSEDCLTLNVIRPSNGTDCAKDLPVAVWIHGGGYQQGGSGDLRYNLSFIVNEAAKTDRPFIAVSINYRLGPWGFLYSREIKGTGNTNLGLRDQRLALHWVQENIAAFGGDPKRVTIWGESAGASSVGIHLVAYEGRDDGLFSGAIMQSGSPIPYQSMNETDFYQPMYMAAVEKAGCDQEADTLQCLRTLSFDKMNTVFNTSMFNGSASSSNPVVDGDLVSKYPSQLLSEGKFVKVPMVIGDNSDEGASFAPRIPFMIPFEFVLQFTGFLSQTSIAALAKLYPNDPVDGVPVETPDDKFPENGPQYKRLATYFGDWFFIANRRKTAETFSAAGVPVYSFRFNAYPVQNPRDLGAGHFTEMAYVFRNWIGTGYFTGGNPVNGTGMKELSSEVSSKWISFFSKGDPNDGGKVSWPKYSDGAENIVFQTEPQRDRGTHVEKDDFRKEAIAYMNSIPLQYAR